MFRQATFIQDVTEFQRTVTPVLRDLFQAYELDLTGCTAEETLRWIIVHQIENSYGLCVQGHTRQRSVYSAFHDQLAMALPYPLEFITRQLIKVPLVYGDQILTVELRGSDLYIHYHLDTALLFQRP